MSIENQIETILNNVPQVYTAGQNSVVDEFREELDEVKEDIRTLDNDIAIIKGDIGDIDTALDELHSYAQALIGGGA